jgi:threonine/homoserine/homoserine lactone efflux protein
LIDYFFLFGILFGLVLAAPVGPVAALCFERTVTEGRWHGFLSGLGAAFADAIFGAIAAFGMGTVSSWIADHQGNLRLVGGTVLVLLAIKTVTAPAPKQTNKVAGRVHTESLPQDFISAFVLAITNPLTVIAFLGLFATWGIGAAEISLWDGAWLVGGVFVGSAVWWIALSAVAGLIRDIIDVVYQRWINRISALILFASGLFVLASLVA